MLFAHAIATLALIIPALAEVHHARAGGSGDEQSSLTIDSSVLNTNAIDDDGQTPPVAGQSPTDESSNNFANFCAQFPNVPITNGLQIGNGSCNQTPMGMVPGKSKQPSTMITNPPNNAVVQSGQDLVLTAQVLNIQVGVFTSATKDYYIAPTRLNDNGEIIGHMHFVVQATSSLDSTANLDPSAFEFFKGVDNAAGADGSVNATIPGGLAAGTYRCCTITTNANHGPVTGPVAQRGAYDECTRFTVSGNGGAAAAAGGSGAAAASPSGAAAATATAAGGNGKNKGGKGKSGRRSNFSRSRRSFDATRRSRINQA